MEEFQRGQGAVRYASSATVTKVLNKVFVWMFAGLIITAITSYVTLQNIGNIVQIAGGNIFFIAAIFEIVVVIALSALSSKMSPMVAQLCFIFYAALNGFTLSTMFLAYEIGVVTTAFLGAAAMFGAMAIYGAVSKKDLSTYGSVGIMLLIGIMVATLLNILIFKSSGFDLFLLYAGLAAFAGLTAYDMQNVKQLSASIEGSADAKLINRVVIMSALNLYLDFINIFIRLVSILGRRSRD
ncbi:MAG: Bax inhibitor-1/YccA family protein [Clostridia bacterium]